MKFQNSTIHGSKLMLYTISSNIKWPEIAKAITPTTFHLIGSKFKQVISFSVPISIPNIKTKAHILFEISS